MNLTQKRAAVLAGVAAAGLAVAGTVAYAGYQRSATASAAGSASERFAPLSVSGEWLGRTGGGLKLLPGESGDVRVVLTNPASNSVSGKIVSITPVTVTQNDITGPVEGGDRAACAGWLSFASYQPSAPNLTVLGNTGQGVGVTLTNAVTLDAAATEKCSGMAFPTTFIVRFEATRLAPGGPTTLQPVPAGS